MSCEKSIILNIPDISPIVHQQVGIIIFRASLSEWASLLAQMVKCLPAVQKTWVRSLCREDPLDKEMAIQSSPLAWKIPRTEQPGGLQSMDHKETSQKHFLRATIIYLTEHAMNMDHTLNNGDRLL